VPQDRAFIDPCEIDPIYLLRRRMYYLVSRGRTLRNLAVVVEAEGASEQYGVGQVVFSGKTTVCLRPYGACLNMMMLHYDGRDRETGKPRVVQTARHGQDGGTGRKPFSRTGSPRSLDLPRLRRPLRGVKMQEVDRRQTARGGSCYPGNRESPNHQFDGALRKSVASRGASKRTPRKARRAESKNVPRRARERRGMVVCLPISLIIL